MTADEQQPDSTPEPTPAQTEPNEDSPPPPPPPPLSGEEDWGEAINAARVEPITKESKPPLEENPPEEQDNLGNE